MAVPERQKRRRAVAAPPVPAGDVLGDSVVVHSLPLEIHEYLSDSDFEDEGSQPQPPPDVQLVLDHVEYLERPTRLAAVHNTAMFMRVTPATAAAAAPGGENSGGEILVHYRCTHFLRANGGADDDEVTTDVMGPKLARVRFHLPAHAAGTTRSLQLAGAALAPLLYPSRFRAELRAMWSALVVKGWPTRGAARVVVTVDAGILRPRHFKQARMGSMFAAMRSALLERDAQPAAVVFDVGAERAELLLPAPLAKENDVRPAKRRRVAGENCPICCKALKKRLAAWPRCSHIFHARCLGEYLVRGSKECPMCRSGLEVRRRRCRRRRE
ncbi:unnamed protein product [Urochloa decumbens]|uniref:RING-type E3 ubiquitin transferase n=1 Tax=Urochloa decumbens TaxID=240449 RepID=A0ABC9B7F0_9POAL